MLKIDKNTILDFEKKWVKKVKIFFYSAGCSGTKVDIMLDDFDQAQEELLLLESDTTFQVFASKEDAVKLGQATITRLLKADHTWEAKPRYIYSNDAVVERCSCGTSFAFEKKKPTFDFSKLKSLKQNIVKK